jgi:hypothetical protein
MPVKLFILQLQDSGNNVTFAGASNSPELDLGKAGSNLGTVTFGGLTEVRDVYANILNIGANDVTAKNAHGADSTLVAGSVLKIKDGGKVGRVSGPGTVTMLGSGELGGVGTAAAPLNTLNLNDGTVALTTGAEDIYAGTVNHKNQIACSKAII